MDKLSKIEVSGFVDANDTRPKPVNLMQWLKGYRKLNIIVDQVRQEPDKDRRNELKKQLPGITPSGTFKGRRTAENLHKHSGLIALDFDYITPVQVKKILSDISNVLYAGLSASGRGVWALIPISDPQHHKRHWESLEADFKHFGLILDPKCQHVNALRFYSYDPDPVFNPDAVTYHKLAPEKVYKPRPQQGGNPDALEKLIQKIEQSGQDITTDYDSWLKIGGALASIYDERGRDLFHRLSRFYPGYSEQKADKQYNKCLRNKPGFTENIIFDIARQHGILLKNEVRPVKQVSGSRPQPEADPWNIRELENFFTGVTIPVDQIVTPGGLITDPAKFIESHLDIVRGQNGKERYKPYLDRLQELKLILKKNIN